MSISAINTTSASTGVQVAIAMPLQGRSKEGRPSAQLEEQRSVENERMRQMVQEMQRQIDSMNVSLEFSTYGENGNKISVVVADKDTGEVIREIPSRELQNLYAKMREITGIIFNTQA
ncbi:MAG: flagellar protein FlaG [Deltaproteobacteria bacterium]|nr:flagellar protein FlaG [Deltaproteobacteria bacterium]